MGWTRRPNSSDRDTNPDSDPLADNLRLNRRRADSAPDDPIYDQQTVVDSNFASRSQARRQRQGPSRLNTQQLGAWAADPGNTQKLLVIGGAFVIFLLLLAAISFYNRQRTPVAGSASDALPSEAAFTDPNAGVGLDPLASADPGLGTAPVPVATIPGSDPAQQPPATSLPAFVVTGTGAEGLFLRPEPSTNGAPITTLPEGTRVEATGETNNDGTREWRKVRSDLGEGWVAADFLQPAP
jgi:hypothetical protein